MVKSNIPAKRIFTCGVRNLSHLPYGLQKLNPQVDVTCIGPFRKQYVTAMQLHRYLTSESSVLASPAQYTCFAALSTASKCPKLGTLCFASPNTSIPQNLLQLPRCLNLREKPSLLSRSVHLAYSSTASKCTTLSTGFLSESTLSAGTSSSVA